MDSVEEFQDNYYFFVHHITSNKKQLETLETIYVVMDAVKSLIKLIEENRSNEVDPASINNLVHFSKVYINTITIPDKITPKKQVIMELIRSIEKLDTILNSEKISQKR